MEEDLRCGIIREVWCKLVCSLISYRRSRVGKKNTVECFSALRKKRKNKAHRRVAHRKKRKKKRTVEFVLNLRNVSSSTDVLIEGPTFRSTIYGPIGFLLHVRLAKVGRRQDETKL